MTITPFPIYLISLADNFKDLIHGMAALSAISIMVFAVKYMMDEEDYCSDEVRQKMKADVKYMKTFLASVIICLLIGCCIPSTRTLVAMYAIPPIVNNSSVQKLPVNLLNFVNNYLEKSKEKEE